MTKETGGAEIGTVCQYTPLQDAVLRTFWVLGELAYLAWEQQATTVGE